MNGNDRLELLHKKISESLQLLIFHQVIEKETNTSIHRNHFTKDKQVTHREVAIFAP